MSDQPKNNRPPLSEISHLFLSSVRDRQTGGATRPQRRPPVSRGQASVELSPDEFAQVTGLQHAAAPPRKASRLPQITALIGAHLNAQIVDRAREYAGHLCAAGARIGIIEVDAAALRIMLFERSAPGSASNVTQMTAEPFDLRRMSEAIQELSCDVDRWLLVLPNPRGAEARAILRMVDDWTLLCTCDDEGVVSCYRALKGLAEGDRPRLSLAVLDAVDQAQADAVLHKLSSVCQQFLQWALEPQARVQRPANIAEHLVLSCRAARESDAGNGSHWRAVSNLLLRSKMDKLATMETMRNEPADKQILADVVVAAKGSPAEDLEEKNSQADKKGPDPFVPSIEKGSDPFMSVFGLEAQTRREACADDVIDLPGADASSANIIAAILENASAQLIECPIRAPQCSQASLAVSSDRRLILLAVAGAGLRDLRSIGQAYQWLMENRALIAMALPQFSIDAHQLPGLRLIVDQADLSAQILQPLLQSSSVSVQAYRKLRWGGRMGLLLNAA